METLGAIELQKKVTYLFRNSVCNVCAGVIGKTEICMQGQREEECVGEGGVEK